MKFKIIIVLIVGLLKDNNVYAIMGNIETKIENFPFQLNLREDTLFYCHASIISEYYAITSASCINGGSIPSNITLFGGSSDRPSGGVKFTAEYYALHPKYNRSTQDYNIAVIRVTEPFNGPVMRPIKLIDENVSLVAGKRAVIAGWGLTSTGGFPFLLQETDIPIVSEAACAQKMEINDRMFCAGELGRDACLLDSGGPVVSEGIQIGVISHRTSICANQLPGIYVRLSNSEIRAFIKSESGV